MMWQALEGLTKSQKFQLYIYIYIFFIYYKGQHLNKHYISGFK